MDGEMQCMGMAVGAMHMGTRSGYKTSGFGFHPIQAMLTD